jgi:NAD(P)-dependent dehydrogenase (short-subunit alcohol dehydrogenase family)
MESTIMNMLCTGNPDHITVASAVKQYFPMANFASRATGYDFTLPEIDELFKKTIIDYNVFINSSYIQAGIQLKLLNMAVSKWMEADVKGHIINIGTTAEWDSSPKYSEYVQSKQELRHRSLALNNETGITGVKTTHIIVGGVNDGKSGNELYVNPTRIVNTIDWVLKNSDRIALIQLDSAK